MATKVNFTFRNETKQAYKEGPFILWMIGDKGPWTVVHEQSGKTVTGGNSLQEGKTWEKKRDALAFAQALIDYEEDGKRINWDTNRYDVFYELNDSDFVRRLWNTVKDM